MFLFIRPVFYTLVSTSITFYSYRTDTRNSFLFLFLWSTWKLSGSEIRTFVWGLSTAPVPLIQPGWLRSIVSNIYHCDSTYLYRPVPMSVLYRDVYSRSWNIVPETSRNAETIYTSYVHIQLFETLIRFSLRTPKRLMFLHVDSVSQSRVFPDCVFVDSSTLNSYRVSTARNLMIDQCHPSE